MKKNTAFLKAALMAAGLPALVLAFGLVVAGCDTGGGGGGGGSIDFSVSGTFTKAGTSADGVVQFELQSGAGYTLSGVLEDGALTIRLNGSYDPNTGNWSVSANSGNVIIYTLAGNVNRAGVSQGASATIAVYNAPGWEPFIFAITVTDVNINDPAGAVDGETDGVPLFARGNWHANVDYGNGYSDSIGVIISDWTVKVSGTSRSPYGTKPIDENWTILEITGSDDGPYEVIACYPDYVPTVAKVRDAAAYCLGISAINIEALAAEPGSSGSWPSGRWVYLTPDYSVWWGGFSSAEINRLFVFQATGGWETWAEANGVTKANRFVKGEMTYTNNKTRFNMVNMVEVANPMMPWEQTYTFDTLALLNAATLVKEHRWNWPESGMGTPTDGGILVMTFTR